MGNASGCKCLSQNNLEAEAVLVEPVAAVGEVFLKTSKFLGDPNGDPRNDSYWKKSSGFNFSRSTEDAYKVKHFTGKNKSIRPLLDYTYHCKYSDERVALQDRLISDFSAAGDQQDDLLLPWVIFTAGAMGAGKGFVLEWMQTQNCLPLKQFVTVDPDAIRQALPEWEGYVAEDPLKAAVFTQKEAGHIAEILGYKALRQRWNVIFDGSLRDVEWYKVYFQKLRHSFPGIRLMILHIEAEREAVLKRAEARGRATGRMVPKEILESSMDSVPESVRLLAPYVDVAIKVLNLDGREPQLVHEPTAHHPPETFPITCEYISQLWNSLDLDGDGELSRAEVSIALAQGLLTREVLETVDENHDGAVSKEELMAAVNKARENATSRLKGGSSSATLCID